MYHIDMLFMNINKDENRKWQDMPKVIQVPDFQNK